MRKTGIGILILLVLWLFCFGIACEENRSSDSDDKKGSGPDDDDDDNDDNNDDNDDDVPEPLDLQGVFVIPNYHYADTDAQIERLLDRILSTGPTTIIWGWTLLYNKVCYPSLSFDELEGMQSDDLIGTLLSAADNKGMRVYLGLSAGRIPSEKFDDPIGPEAQRGELLIDELTSMYGHHQSLAGFYLPYEFIRAPKEDEVTLLSRITTKAHSALPGSEVLLSTYYKGPSQNLYAKQLFKTFMFPGMSQDILDDAKERAVWASKTVDALTRGGIDRVLLKTMMGNYKNDFKEAVIDFSVFIAEVESQNSPLLVSAQIDLYDPLFFAGKMTPVHGPVSADRVEEQIAVADKWDLPGYGFAWDHYVNDNGDVLPPRTGTDAGLLEKTKIIEEHLRGRGFRDGNIVTVINGQLPLDMLGNLWQEDACWINGLYCGAESFRCAVTGEEEACEYARQMWRVLQKMADVTPLKGEVVRNYSYYLYEQLKPVSPTSSTIKRWHKHPTEEVYWVGDISVDQLSGYFYGLTAFYELVANESEREEIRQDISRIMGLIVDNNLQAYEYNGENTTYGDLRAAPELALTFLMMAWRITGESRFYDAFDKLIHKQQFYWRLILFHWATHLWQKYGGQHFHDSSLYHLYSYLPADPWVFRELIWGVEYVYKGSFTWGNAMANFTHQAHNPDSAGAARSLHNHYMYNPYYLDNGIWANEVNQSFEGQYHPMEYRPFDEWDWTVAPYRMKKPRGGPNHRYPGVSYLVTYWEGRWHGWIP